MNGKQGKGRYVRHNSGPDVDIYNRDEETPLAIILGGRVVEERLKAQHKIINEEDKRTEKVHADLALWAALEMAKAHPSISLSVISRHWGIGHSCLSYWAAKFKTKQSTAVHKEPCPCCHVLIDPRGLKNHIMMHQRQKEVASGTANATR